MSEFYEYDGCDGICFTCDEKNRCTINKGLKYRASKLFTNPADALIAFRKIIKLEEKDHERS